MLYIFWILGMLAFKLAIVDQCQCILLYNYASEFCWQTFPHFLQHLRPCHMWSMRRLEQSRVVSQPLGSWLGDTRYQISDTSGRYQIPLAGRYQRLICSQIPTILLETPYYTRSYLTWHHIKPHQFIPPHTGAYHTRQPTILLSFFFTSHKHILIELRRQQGTKAAFILYH